MQTFSKTIRQAFTIGVCTLSLLAGAQMAQSAPPAAAGAVNPQVFNAGLGLLEDRFFSRQYANDPVEKRLERLELLVFGATQGGSSEQRWKRIKDAIATRAQKDPDAKGQSAAGGAKKPGASSVDQAGKYPVLNTLEWRALKKTYQGETLDQRLARIEQKIFGQESPGMPYFDRVERLKRTLGIGVAAVTAPTGPLGPAPKARPRGQGADAFGDFGFNSPFFTQPDPGERIFGRMDPFTNPFQSMPFNSAFNQMFAELNRQMAQLEQLDLGPGSWNYDSQTGEWVEQFTGKKVKPGQKSQIAPSPKQPRVPTPVPTLPFNLMPDNSDTQLPPYADPNSI